MQRRSILMPLLLVLLLLFPAGCAQKKGGSLSVAHLRRIGVLTSASYSGAVRDSFPSARLYFYEDLMAMAMALDGNRVDAIAFMSDGLDDLTEAYPNFQKLATLSVNDTASACFRPSDRELYAQFNDYISQIRQDGTLDSICQNWLSSDGQKKFYHPRKDLKGEPLDVGVEVGQSFLTFVQDGEEAGLEPELVIRFAESVGRPVRFQEMTGTGLLPALAADRIDMVVDDISPTDERVSNLLFSDPYFISPVCLIVKQGNLPVWKGLRKSLHQNIFQERRGLMILEGLWITLYITLLSILLGSVLGFLLCIAKRSKRPFWPHFAESYCAIVDGIPILVLLLIMFYVVFAATHLAASIVAIVTFSLHFAAGASECFYTGLNSVGDDQFEAALAMGFSRRKATHYIIFPQAAVHILPTFKSLCVALLENTALVGFIAIKDLTKVTDIIRSQTYDALIPLGVLAIIYFFLTRLLGTLLDRLGNNLLKHYE